MKNEDRRIIEGIISYCRDVNKLMMEYNSDYNGFEWENLIWNIF